MMEYMYQQIVTMIPFLPRVIPVENDPIVKKIFALGYSLLIGR